MTTLVELQQQFQQFVLGGDFAVVRALEDGPRGKPGPRLAIYHDAYRLRLREALADTFGTLWQHLGNDEFGTACARYVEARPSTFRNVRWYGTDFADFLRCTAPYARQPVLAEIAQLDWALVSAFDAADAVPRRFEDLADLAPAAWAEVAFEFHPAVRMLSLTTNAPALRMAADRDQPLPAAITLDAPTEWLVWRRDHDTHFRSVHDVEATALDAAIAGASFPEICAHVGALLDADQAAAQVAAWLRQWVDTGLIVAADPARRDGNAMDNDARV